MGEGGCYADAGAAGASAAFVVTSHLHTGQVLLDDSHVEMQSAQQGGDVEDED